VLCQQIERGRVRRMRRGGGEEEEVTFKSEQRRDNQMHLTLSVKPHTQVR
jgi:hypothetical protein